MESDVYRTPFPGNPTFWNSEFSVLTEKLDKTASLLKLTFQLSLYICFYI